MPDETLENGRTENGKAEAGTAEPASRRTTATGPGRVLITVYAIFALAATSRAGVQIATKFHEAPVAYVLSAFSAVVYLLATVALARSGRTWWRVAVIACTVEFLGVLTIGTLSVFDRAAFPQATVWSVYGEGYLFIPLVLPVIGLFWLRRTARSVRQGHPESSE